MSLAPDSLHHHRADVVWFRLFLICFFFAPCLGTPPSFTKVGPAWIVDRQNGTLPPVFLPLCRSLFMGLYFYTRVYWYLLFKTQFERFTSANRAINFPAVHNSNFRLLRVSFTPLKGQEQNCKLKVCKRHLTASPPVSALLTIV